MLIDFIDWVQVMRVVGEKTGKTKIELCREMGIEGGVLNAFRGCSTPPDPRYSEGAYLLAMFNEVTNNGTVPMLKRSLDVRCPCCTRLRPRGEIMRLSYNKFRCVTCVDNAKNRKRG